MWPIRTALLSILQGPTCPSKQVCGPNCQFKAKIIKQSHACVDPPWDWSESSSVWYSLPGRGQSLWEKQGALCVKVLVCTMRSGRGPARSSPLYPVSAHPGPFILIPVAQLLGSGLFHKARLSFHVLTVCCPTPSQPHFSQSLHWVPVEWLGLTLIPRSAQIGLPDTHVLTAPHCFELL